MTFSQATREYLPYKGHGVAISIDRHVVINRSRGAIQIEADILEAAQLCMEKIKQDDRQSRAYGKTYKMLAPFMSWQERLDCGEGVFLDAEQDRQWQMPKHLFLEQPKEHSRAQPAKNRRLVFNSILWILISGSRWCDLPECEQFVKRSTAHRWMLTLQQDAHFTKSNLVRQEATSRRKASNRKIRRRAHVFLTSTEIQTLGCSLGTAHGIGS